MGDFRRSSLLASAVQRSSFQWRMHCCLAWPTSSNRQLSWKAGSFPISPPCCPFRNLQIGVYGAFTNHAQNLFQRFLFPSCTLPWSFPLLHFTVSPRHRSLLPSTE